MDHMAEVEAAAVEEEEDGTQVGVPVMIPLRPILERSLINPNNAGGPLDSGVVLLVVLRLAIWPRIGIAIVDINVTVEVVGGQGRLTRPLRHHHLAVHHVTRAQALGRHGVGNYFHTSTRSSDAYMSQFMSIHPAT